MRNFTVDKCPFCGSDNIVKVESLYAHDKCNECGKHFGIVNGKLSTLDKGFFGVWIPLKIKEKVIFI